ncbi:MAG: adenylate kinase [Clostridiales bacterium]|nr:adenylate kinase [Clostridiales bacterium]
MIIILLGAPGSGKGTQAKMLSSKFNIPHISTGDIFRRNIKENTLLGKKAKMYIDKGQLVPDEVTCEIVDDRINMDDCRNGFILDGFPRTIFQANELENMLQKLQLEINYVLNIVVTNQSVITRISGRRMCNCGQIYHIDRNPTKIDGICDVCGEATYIRDDDQPKTIKTRLQAYHQATKPLEDYYLKKGLLINIDGEPAPKEVFNEVVTVI